MSQWKPTEPIHEITWSHDPENYKFKYYYFEFSCTISLFIKNQLNTLIGQ
jgi:hypothetical protein